MVSTPKKRYTSLIIIFLGALLTCFTWKQLPSKIGDIKANPLALKGSPYGRTIALAMQGNIDNYWHKGSSHDHDHDHDHDHTLDSSPIQSIEDSKEVKKNTPNHLFIKHKIRELLTKNELNNSGYQLTEAHEKLLQEKTLQQIISAYEMDRTNYTNYNNYHFFLTSYGFVHEERKVELAKQLADQTIHLCKNEQKSPTIMLTAILGYEHKTLLMLETPNLYTINDFDKIFAAVNQITKNYNSRFDQLLKTGEIHRFSQARIEETTGRFKMLMGRFQALHKIVKSTYSNPNQPI